MNGHPWCPGHGLSLSQLLLFIPWPSLNEPYPLHTQYNLCPCSWDAWRTLGEWRLLVSALAGQRGQQSLGSVRRMYVSNDMGKHECSRPSAPTPLHTDMSYLTVKPHSATCFSNTILFHLTACLLPAFC